MSTPTADGTSLSRPAVVRMWTVQDVARFLGVPAKTLYDWRTKGYGPKGIRVGRYIRYRHEDVYAWVDNQEVT
jgi:predicted DNA-binding transcriptional regulator AlpA